MIRVLIFILSVILVAYFATILAGMDGLIEIEAFGHILTFGHAGLGVGAVAGFILLLIFFTSWFKDLAALPGKLRTREREAKRARGVAALTRGLEAVAVGDATDAQHHARVAQRNLDDAALTRLLTAQAAQLAGDEAAAGESFTAMLEAPETEFLGLRGLYLKAMREGDKAAAQGYAERAFRLRPNASWAYESVFELGLQRGAWGETRNALAIAIKNKIVDVKKGRRGEAALLTADAFAARLSGNNSLALQEAEAALKLAPSFAPAAVLAAECHADAGKKGRAAKILENAFAEAPHPALARTHDDLYKDETVEVRAGHMKKLAERKPTARAARLVLARRHNLLGAYEDAVQLLEPLLMEAASARETAVMAEAVAGAHDQAAAQIWLEKAAAAPRDPTPGADGAFHFTRDGWTSLVREYMEHGRLAPPPIEDAPRGLSLDELKQLAPPPPVTTPEPEEATAAEAPAKIDAIDADAEPVEPAQAAAGSDGAGDSASANTDGEADAAAPSADAVDATASDTAPSADRDADGEGDEPKDPADAVRRVM